MVKIFDDVNVKKSAPRITVANSNFPDGAAMRISVSYQVRLGWAGRSTGGRLHTEPCDAARGAHGPPAHEVDHKVSRNGAHENGHGDFPVTFHPLSTVL